MTSEADATLIDNCIREFLPAPRQEKRLKVLDFGCGDGLLVRALERLGYEASGCDIASRWAEGDERFRRIEVDPYRLPYDDASFDVIFSTSVFEHVLRKEESLREIGRLLRDDGVTIHIFPSKYYLPYEPHLFVPLLNYFWPTVPNWYLAFWALVGVRNGKQRDMPWRDVVTANQVFCHERLSYWPASRYHEAASKLIGECMFAPSFFARASSGRAAKIVRSFLGARLGGRLLGLFRYAMLVAWKRTAGRVAAVPESTR
jgi:SAM-dependent methyltransferase